MQSSNYSFLDLTVMPFLRRKVVTGEAALVFDSELNSILWANAAGTKLFGGNNVGELLEIDLSNASELMEQVKNALTQIHDSEPIVRGYRVSKGITSQLIKGELSLKTLPNGSQVALLVFAENKNSKRKKEHELAAMAVDSLEGFADAAAIVDEFGLTIASSSKFDDMNVYPTVLQDLVKVTASENDRMVKRPIEQFANKTIAAGIGRIRDVPGRYLIVLADLDEDISSNQENISTAPRETAALIDNVEQNIQNDTLDDNDLEDAIRLKLKDDVSTQDVFEPDAFEQEETLEDADDFYEYKANKDEPSLIDRLQLDKNLENSSTSQDASSNFAQGTQDEPFELSGDENQTSETKPLRFSFTIGANKVFREVSPELAKSVGPQSAEIIGLSWSNISDAYGFDATGAINNLLESADTWAGKSVLWPVQDTDMLIPLDLAALPVFTKSREFDGFRGFGIIRSEDAIVDPDGRGLRINEIRQGINQADQNKPLKTQDVPFGKSKNPREDNTPGILSDSWESELENTNQSDRSDEQNNLSDNTDIKTDEPNDDQPISNVTPLNVVPIRSHVEITRDTTTTNDEDRHDRLFEEHDRDNQEHSLNQKERSAFEQIRRRLQKENHIKPRNIEKDIEVGHKATSDADHSNTPTDTKSTEVDFGSAVLVYRADETLFANDALLKIAGYESLDELTKAGGLEALLPLDELNGDLDDNDEFATLNLKRKDGSLIIAQPILKRVDWDGAKALSLTFIKAETKPTATVESYPTGEPSALDMVRVSDLESILDTATDGIIIVNSSGNIEALNAPGEALFGKSFDDVVGDKFTSLFAKESQRSLDEYFSNLNNPGVNGIINDGREVIGVEANGGMIPLFISLGAIGQSNRYCAVLRDLTEWKKSEESLVTAKRNAETASDQKTEFLSRISHEIREPLNAIIGFSDVMIEERFGELDNARYREYLRDINRSGVHMLDLVNDLLDISKIEAGKLDLSYESVDLNLIARETVALLQPQANSQRIIIRTSLSRAVPNVVADVRSIRQIIMNLVSNAIKFSPPNSQVIVSTTYETNGEVGLRIRDTGNGMSEKELKLALEPYTQIANEHAGKNAGTGLGLPLTKALVEANRAYFDLESTPGEGTIAHVQFPSPRVLAD